MDHPEEEPYEVFKEIRRRIRRYSSESLIHALSTKLNSEITTNEMGGQPPFALLLLLKWAIKWGNEPGHGKRHIDNAGYVSLVNLWHRMHANMVMPNDCSHINVFMRMLAYQQFWLQRPPTISTFSRQFILFRRPESTHFFNSIFRAEYGIELEDYLDLATGLLTFLSEKPSTFLRPTWFSNASKRFSADVISSYFKLISSDFHDHRKVIKSFKSPPLIEEFYERSPFRLRPFIFDKKSNVHIPISNALIGYYLVDGAYELLRRPNPDKFMTRFGSIFQEYVENCISYTNSQFDREVEIQKITRSNENCDFVIKNKDALIFIDAKGVEMRFKGHVSTDSRSISENIRNSVNKGIRQGFSTNHCYKQLKGNSTKEAFIMVVTYKELYLGDGLTFAESVGTSLLEEMMTQYPECSQIPPENMFFLALRYLVWSSMVRGDWIGQA
jgi:hypothetical protein